MGEQVSDVEEIMRGTHVIDGAGVHLNRIIGSPRIDHIDPFVLLDEFRSDNPNDYLRGFPWHPHRGIETVTYMINGEFEHQDSKGGGGLLTPGTVQWMTAGRGILHQEMPKMEEGLLWGYQLWLTLPRKDKMVPPRYQHLSAEMMPEVKSGGSTVKIISGKYGGNTGPANTWSPISYLDVRLERGAEFKHIVGKSMGKFAYVHTGAIAIDPEGVSKEVESGSLVVLDDDVNVVIKGAAERNGFLFFAGTPLNEPIARGGPFVMNTREEIAQAFEDYQEGKLF